MIQTKNKSFLKIAYFAVLVQLLSFRSSLAGGTYEQLEPIPGQPATDSLITYLGNLYRFGISISGVLAIFMIAFGAFVYVITSAGNSSKMADAKDMIYNAIYGLIIALLAYLILFVVNPDLVGGPLRGVPGVREFIL